VNLHIHITQDKKLFKLIYEIYPTNSTKACSSFLVKPLPLFIVRLDIWVFSKN